MTYFLQFAFDGTRYHGWQFQPNVRSVQGTIEETLTHLFKSEIIVYGCGRTDAGVHASQYFLHIHLEEALNFDLKFRLNKNLPEDIAVLDILEMKEKQHARYDATSRTYDYFIHLNKNPILRRYSSFYELENLDFAAMQTATELFTKYDDFKAICKQPLLYKHTICKVTHAKLYVDEASGRLRFSITANRFLRGMVRFCVFFLLEVGQGKLSLAEFENILANKLDVRKKSALPNGLHLSRVEYPYLKSTNTKSFLDFLKVGLEE